MTYRNLLKFLNTLTDEELNMNVTIRIDSEFWPVSNAMIEDTDGILDNGHPFLSI